MSAMKVAAAMWPTARKILLAIGRWLVSKVRKFGAQKLAAYMELRVDVFEERLGRARRNRRKKWLRGRIRRWNAAIAWLRSNARKLNKKVADEIDKLAIGARIPTRVPVERFA